MTADKIGNGGDKNAKKNVVDENAVAEMKLTEPRPFKNHPFKVLDDELMRQWRAVICNGKIYLPSGRALARAAEVWTSIASTKTYRASLRISVSISGATAATRAAKGYTGTYLCLFQLQLYHRLNRVSGARLPRESDRAKTDAPKRADMSAFFGLIEFTLFLLFP